MGRIAVFILALFVLTSFTGPGDPPEVGISFNSFWKSKSVAIAGYTKINARYEWVAGAFDSGLHVPQYNGVPSGTRSGVWNADGAVAVDTSNHRLYFYSGGSWRYSTSGTGGGTPTLQQVLTAGSTLTTNNTVDADGNTFNIDNTPRFRILDDNSSTERLFIAQTGASVSAPTRYTTKLSSGIKSDVQRYLMLSPDSTVLTGIPYTLSTTGKKIMLRDTATGLVQNIDPALIGGSTAISALTAATGTNTIDNGAYSQRWEWNTLSGTGGTGLDLYSNSTAADFNAQTLFKATLQGANSNSTQTTQAAVIQNTHSGTSSTNIGLYVASTSGTNNYALIVPSSGGSVGIGTSTPASILHTVGTVRHASLGTASGDTTTNKPVGINSSGDIIPMTYWPGGGGGGSGVTTMAAIGSSPNANGATISGSTLNLEPASASFGGVVTTGTQSFAGTKTFTGIVGIGASPTYNLDVFGGGFYGTVRIRGASGGGFIMGDWNSNTGGFWSGGITPTVSNYSILANNAGNTFINAASGQLVYLLTNNGTGTAGAVLGDNGLAINSGLIAPTSGNSLIVGSGRVGIGTVSPTAFFHIKAGTSSAQTAPLKFTSGTNLTTAEAGAVEYDGKDLFFTPTGTIRKVIPTIISSRSTGQTAAVSSVATQTVGASDASFLVSANILITTSSAEAFTTTVAYTDEGNTARTLTLNYSLLAGTIGVTIAAANGAVPYQGVPVQIRCKASTTITIATTGTFTGCTYNVEGTIQKIQ